MRSSEEHIGYFNSKGSLLPYESAWCWYIVRLGVGSHRIRFAGAAAHANPRLGAWLWTERDLSAETVSTPFSCTAPAMPPYCDRIDRQGICLAKPG